MTDWLSSPSIPKVALLAIDEWSHNALPPSFHHLLPLLFTSRVFSYFSPLYPPCLICHPHHFISSPPFSLHFPHSSVHPSIHSSFPPSLLRPLPLSFIDAAEIDAEDNGHWAHGEPAKAVQVHRRGTDTTWMIGRESKDELMASEVRW